jgi:hypothetical protein
LAFIDDKRKGLENDSELDPVDEILKRINDNQADLPGDPQAEDGQEQNTEVLAGADDEASETDGEENADADDEDDDEDTTTMKTKKKLPMRVSAARAVTKGAGTRVLPRITNIVPSAARKCWQYRSNGRASLPRSARLSSRALPLL